MLFSKIIKKKLGPIHSPYFFPSSSPGGRASATQSRCPVLATAPPFAFARRSRAAGAFPSDASSLLLIGRIHEHHGESLLYQPHQQLRGGKTTSFYRSPSPAIVWSTRSIRYRRPECVRISRSPPATSESGRCNAPSIAGEHLLAILSRSSYFLSDLLAPGRPASEVLHATSGAYYVQHQLDF